MNAEFPSTFSLHIQWDSEYMCVPDAGKCRKKDTPPSDVRSEKKEGGLAAANAKAGLNSGRARPDNLHGRKRETDVSFVN